MLKFSHIVKIERNKRCFFDRRKIADWYICSYYDFNNHEYRKSFWVKCGNNFVPILSGTHDELNIYSKIIIE
jgi:hypothetical protein